MAAEYDNLLKYIAETHGAALASWLLDRPVGDKVKLLKTELSLQPIRADYMAQYDLEEEITWNSRPIPATATRRCH